MREGNKVQTPWLTAFLKDPHMIRPAAQLRMPRFHYGKSMQIPSHETEELANYFAARDRTEFPYQTIPEQNSELSGGAQQGPSRLPGGRLADDDEQGLAVPSVPCDRPVQAQRRRPGRQRARPPRGRAPVPARLSLAWIANPRRLVPFTAMPQNIAPHGTVQILVPKTFENKPFEMVKAVRDTLLNYVNAVELQLASSSREATPGRNAPQDFGEFSVIEICNRRDDAMLNFTDSAGRRFLGLSSSATPGRRAWPAAAVNPTRARPWSFPSPTA